jgi:hypothetical protein
MTLKNEEIIVGPSVPKEFIHINKFFIVGPPRSGTTLVNSIISDKYFLPECTFISNLFRSFMETYKYGEQERFHYYCYSLSNLVEIYKKPIYDLLYTAKIVSNNILDKYIVYKDPVLANYIQYFDLFFPGTYKVIYCIRDPRDTVASMYSVLSKQNPDTPSSELFNQAIQLIFPYYQIIYQIENSDPDYNRERICLLKYENLVMLDNLEIKKLESFLKIKINNFKENIYVKGKLDEKSPFYSENYGKSITTTPVGNYKKGLSREQIAEVERIFIYSLDHFGYISR